MIKLCLDKQESTKTAVDTPGTLTLTLTIADADQDMDEDGPFHGFSTGSSEESDGNGSLHI
jgi:hypothetical protein